MRKKMMATMMAAAMSAAFAFTAFAGQWAQDEIGYKYQNDSGSYARDQIMAIDGVTYGFDQNAYMVNGWKQFDSKWYYFEPGTGYQVSGWKQIGDLWYYLNPNNGNATQTSWLRIGANLYYFNQDGSMQPGNTRFFVNGFAYDTKADGSVKRNVTEDMADEYGRILIYEDDGKIKYKNNTLVTGNKAAGSDVYVYLMEDTLNEGIKQEVNQGIADAIQDKKDELYEKYREDVLSVTKATRRANKRAEWEDKARRSLSALSATETEIATYIYEVEYGQYGKDDYDYDYEYDYDYDYYDYD